MIFVSYALQDECSGAFVSIKNTTILGYIESLEDIEDVEYKLSIKNTIPNISKMKAVIINWKTI